MLVDPRSPVEQTNLVVAHRVGDLHLEPMQAARAERLGVGKVEEAAAEVVVDVGEVRGERVGTTAKVEIVREVEAAADERLSDLDLVVDVAPLGVQATPGPTALEPLLPPRRHRHLIRLARRRLRRVLEVRLALARRQLADPDVAVPRADDRREDFVVDPPRAAAEKVERGEDLVEVAGVGGRLEVEPLLDRLLDPQHARFTVSDDSGERTHTTR